MFTVPCAFVEDTGVRVAFVTVEKPDYRMGREALERANEQVKLTMRYLPRAARRGELRMTPEQRKRFFLYRSVLTIELITAAPLEGDGEAK